MKKNRCLSYRRICKLLLSIVAVANSMCVWAQKDSLGLRNAIGFELFGNSPVHQSESDYLPSTNLNYQRFFVVNQEIRFQVKIGFSFRNTFTGSKKMDDVYSTPVEVGLLLGHRPLKLDMGIGYTPQFGRQQIVTYVGAGHSPRPNQSVVVDYYDQWNLRFGIAVLSRKRFHPLFRCALMPLRIPKHNPIPDEGMLAGMRRVSLYWGVTLGVAF
jgi:hypothetical protein